MAYHKELQEYDFRVHSKHSANFPSQEWSGLVSKVVIPVKTGIQVDVIRDDF